MIDTFFHEATHFAHHTHDQPSMSTAGAVGLGVAMTASVGLAAYAGYRVVRPMTLRDSNTQVPDFDPLTPTGNRGRSFSATPPVVGETGDPATEFLSPTPTGRLRKNNRARFF
jgi:hypothetical protein